MVRRLRRHATIKFHSKPMSFITVAFTIIANKEKQKFCSILFTVCTTKQLSACVSHSSRKFAIPNQRQRTLHPSSQSNMHYPEENFPPVNIITAHKITTTIDWKDKKEKLCSLIDNVMNRSPGKNLPEKLHTEVEDRVNGSRLLSSCITCKRKESAP